MNEIEWWETYGHLNERIWQYDESLNEIIRSEYLADIYTTLFKPGGRLLDFGCGTGWVSRPLALQGMAVDGIDGSAAQIRKAKERAQALRLTNTRYWRSDRLPTDHRASYDALLLHAVVHHIPSRERPGFFQDTAKALAVGGQLYLYDPLAATPNAPWQAWTVGAVMGAVFRVLGVAAMAAHLYEREIEEALRAGWTMRSPKEQPCQMEQLLQLLPPQLSVTRTTPWHCWSIAYGNFCMGLRDPWRKRFGKAAPLIYQIDRHFRTTKWVPYLRSWPMVSILAEKHA